MLQKQNGKYTVELIETIASEIRCERSMHMNTGKGEIAGTCKDISDSLIRDLDIPAERVYFEMGSQRESHHAVVIRMRDVVDDDFNQAYSDDEFLLVDPTIEQFSTENKHRGIVGVALADADDLPRVGIYPPRCKERIRWYHLPDGSADNFDALDTFQPTDL